MDESKVLRELRADGLELLGEITLGGAVVVGDPSLLGQMPAHGAYHAAAVRKGRWLVLGRPDDADPDALVEVVLVQEDELARFWDAYDDAMLVAEIPVNTGRVLAVDGMRKDARELRQQAYEPDEDGLPWVLEAGVVLGAETGEPVRVYQPATDKLPLVALNFGVAPRASLPVPEG